MTTATRINLHLTKAEGESITRLHQQVDFCAYSEDPKVYIRNAWTQSDQRQSVLSVGTEIALNCGQASLICSLRNNALSGEEIYARMLPTDIALKEDISLKVWPQWRCAGTASDYFAFDKALPGLPWRWNFRRQDNAVLIVPNAQTMSTSLGLQISRPFPNEPLLELHPYAGSWAHSNTFFERNPPAYPNLPGDAWGWLLPSAAWDFEFEGYRFRSVWEYAVNPILRSRSPSPESILERLVRATEHRLVVDEVWRMRAKQHSEAVRLLATQTAVDEKRHLYFSMLSYRLQQILNQPPQRFEWE